MSNSTNKPAQTFKAGAIKATIWSNTSTSDKTYHTVTIARVYKKEEQWKETTSFGRDDLPKVNLVASQAYEWILEQKKSDDPTASKETKTASKTTKK